MDLDEFVRRARSKGIFVLDLETTGLSFQTDRILGAALQADGRQMWEPTPTPSALNQLREKLQPLLEDPEISMVGHNLPFDIGMLESNNIRVRNKPIDTMVAAHLLNEDRKLMKIEGMKRASRLGLKKLVFEEFDYRMNTLDDVGGLFGPDLATYAQDDVRQTWNLWQLYEQQMKNEDERLLKVFHEIDMPLIPMIVEMELTGVEIDKVHLRHYDNQLAIEQAQLANEIHALAGKEFLVSSASQVSHILFEHLKLPTDEVPFSGKSGQYSTDRRVLGEALAGIPIVDKIVAWRSKAMHRRTFVRGLLKNSQYDGRFRAHFNLTGTLIGRLCVDGSTVLDTTAGSVRISELDLINDPCSILSDRHRYCRILAVIYKGEEEMYEVETESGNKITCTAKHKFLTPDGWASLDNIGLKGEVIVTKERHQCSRSKIIKITSVGIRGVWDISVEEDESYIAHGFINHNSSSRPLNLQNMPRTKGGIRYAFIASAGKVIVCADLSQIELRLCAHYTKDEEMLSVYRAGMTCECEDFKRSLAEKGEGRCTHIDLHTRTAINLDIPRSPVAKACFSADTMMLTSEGFRRCDEIIPQEGERFPLEIDVETPIGLRKTTHGIFRPNERMIDVETDLGLKITVTEDHRFPVIEDGHIKEKMSSDLSEGDVLLIKIDTNRHGTSTSLPPIDAIERCKHLKLPGEISKDIARFFGYFVAEGSGHKKSIAIGLDGGSQLTPEVKRCFESLCGDRVKTRIGNDCDSIKVSSVEFYHWLQRAGFGLRSKEQNIPLLIRSAPFWVKREFFMAYFEGDGGIKGSYISCCSKSETLIRQIHAEMMNIGIVGYINSEWRPTKKGQRKYWLYRIGNPRMVAKFEEKIGFISEKKRSKLRNLVSKSKNNESRRCPLVRDGFVNVIQETMSNHDLKYNARESARNVLKGKAPITSASLEKYDVLLESLQQNSDLFSFIHANNMWTVKVRSVSPAEVADSYDVYEPETKIVNTWGIMTYDCNFGLLYGMQPKKLKTYAELASVEEAAEVRKDWFDLYNGVAAFHEKVVRELEGGKRIYKTLFGRRRRLFREFEMDPHRAFRQACQFLISGSSQDLLKLSTIEILREKERRALEDPRWREVKFILQIHDELVLEAPKEIAEDVLKLVIEKMEGGPTLRVPVIASGGVGDRWESAKP